MSIWLYRDPSIEYSRPSRILDQHFGHGLLEDDLFAPIIPRELNSLLHHGPAGYLRPWKSQESYNDCGSTVTFDKDKFQANLDVQQFKPEEITVEVTGDNVVTVEGKHEEKQDEHGFVSRHFVRRYVLPKGHDIKQVESKLSSDGVLSIIAPKIGVEQSEEHRKIPIVHTGKPSKAVEEKKQEKERKK